MESNISTHLHVYRRVIKQRGATSSVPSTLLLLYELEVSYTLQMCFPRLASILRSDLHSTRRRFLELHDKMLANSFLSSSGARTLQQAHIATLKEQYSTPEAETPENFRMFIFEWPARIRIGCMRPVFYSSTLKRATYNASSGSTTLLTPTCGSRVQTPTMVASYLITKTHSDLYDDMVGYLRRLPLVDWPSRALVVHLRRTIYPHGWSGSFVR